MNTDNRLIAVKGNFLFSFNNTEFLIILSLIINGQGSPRDLFAPSLLFPSFTTGSLSSESDKGSKLSFGMVDDKDSLLPLESEIKIEIFVAFLIYLHYTNFALSVTLLCMTFAKLNFPIYISIHLFLHKKYELHFLVFFQQKKYTQKRFLWRVRMHTDTQTHNKYASNDLLEFHRFQPEDLYLKFCNKTSVKNNHFNRSILSLIYSKSFPPK